jgi:hypothetical protein
MRENLKIICVGEEITTYKKRWKYDVNRMGEEKWG